MVKRRPIQTFVFDDADIESAADLVLSRLPREVIAKPTNDEIFMKIAGDVARLHSADATKEWSEEFARRVARRVSFKLPALRTIEPT